MKKNENEKRKKLPKSKNKRHEEKKFVKHDFWYIFDFVSFKNGITFMKHWIMFENLSSVLWPLPMNSTRIYYLLQFSNEILDFIINVICNFIYKCPNAMSKIFTFKVQCFAMQFNISEIYIPWCIIITITIIMVEYVCYACIRHSCIFVKTMNW